MIRRFAVGMAWVVMTAPSFSLLFAQKYPDKPIRFLTAEPGGGNDFAARTIAQGISGALGQQVIVDNRPGFVSAETVARAAPDGYTMLLSGASLWIVPLLRDAPYDVKQLAPVTLTTLSPTILSVHPSVRAKSVQELIGLAKASPGAVNVAVGGLGTASHFAMELFKSMAHIDIVSVPYKGSGGALNGLIGGEVQAMFANAAAIAPHVKAGRLRALAVTSAKPSTIAPDLPTMAASGVPGYESTSMYGVLVPAGTPNARINYLNQEMVRFLHQEEVKEKFLRSGVEAIGSSPEEFATAIKSDVARLGKVIKAVGLRRQDTVSPKR